MATPRRPYTPPKKAKPQSSGGGGVIIFLLLVLVLGGGGYYWYQQDVAAKEKARLERLAAEKKAAKEKAAREKAERERLAAEKAERERLAAEEAERLRREAEEAERRRREQEQTTDEPEPQPEPEPEPEPEPTPTPTEQPAQSPYDAPLVLSGTEGNSRTSNETYNGMIDHLLQAGDFNDFARAFAAKLKAEAPLVVGGEKLNYNLYKSSKNMVQAVDLCQVIRMSGQEELAKLLKTAPNEPTGGKAFFEWLLRDKSQPLHAFMQNFTLEGAQRQNMTYALNTFYEIWKSCPPKERAKYLNPAIACALVRPEHARSNGMLRNPTSPVLSIVQVFNYFREMDAKRKLLTDIKKMSVERLLHVVDLRLTQSEIDWVHENLTYTRDKWGEAYGSIRYRMDRAANGKDPYVHYTFAELRKEGGVCRDQAYFCGTTAKCKGIPAIYTVGDGDRGPHAWVVLCVADNQWSQINNYGYTTGRFSGPCSGQNRHESVFLSQTKVERAGKIAPAADSILLSRFLSDEGCAEEARGCARYTAAAFPTLTAAWDNLIATLSDERAAAASTNEWRKAYNEMSRLGSKNGELVDLAAKVQDEHLMEGRTAGAQKNALDNTVRQMKRNMGNDRADLVVDTIERQAKLMEENKDYRGMLNLYKKQLKDYAGRGDVFQQLLGHYFAHMDAMEAPELEWSRMAKEVDKIFSKNVLTNTGDYFKLTKEVAIQQQVANCYERAGNAKKAAKMKEEAEQRLQNSKSRFQGQ